MSIKKYSMIARLVFALLILWFAGAAQALPKIESWKTDKGAKVLFVAAHELPILDVRIVFDAGSARDGDKAGVAALTNALLDQGAAGMDADAIAAGFEQRGAKLGSGSERDMAWLSLRSLSDEKLLKPALDLFRKVLASPDFPEADFERERQRTLTGLEYEKQRPKSLVENAFYHDVYARHPYAGNPSGEEDSVAALSVADLRAFYRRYYVARNATLVLVGDISRKQAETIAARLADALPAGEKAPPLPEVAALKGASTQFIEYPSTQSNVLMGQPGVRRGDPDYFALYVGNHVLGGSGLVSRISEEIREKRGLSYSAYSYFVPMRQDGPYTLGFQTRNEKREEALAVLRDTVRKFVEQGPTEKELKASKDNIIGGFPLAVSSNSKITEYLAMIGFYDLPLDYLSTFTDRIQAVTAKQIRDAFRRRVKVDDMVTVIVGSKSSSSSDAGS
ncbi:MAG: pitrilysin family protein [Gammaproteobacteria bacterium]|jgi:zinc protease